MAPTRADRAHLPQLFRNAFFSHFFRSIDRTFKSKVIRCCAKSDLKRILERFWNVFQKLLSVIEQTRYLIGTRANDTRYIAGES